MARVVRLDPLWRRAFGFPARQPVWSLVVAVAVFAFAAASATSASVGQGLGPR